jgi:hypothetical protein
LQRSERLRSHTGHTRHTGQREIGSGVQQAFDDGGITRFDSHIEWRLEIRIASGIDLLRALFQRPVKRGNIALGHGIVDFSGMAREQQANTDGAGQ